MNLHDDGDKRLQPTRHSPMGTSPANARFGMRFLHRAIKRFKRPERLLHDAEIVDDSPMITMCYEAHLSKQKMLAAFAELRGDDAADAIG
jgi:hypothetical protein